MVGGVLLFKTIMSYTQADTTATSLAIREKLSNLHLSMGEHNHDIRAFNNYVKQLLNKLTARGETYPDLMINLFKGYEACRDSSFVSYMQRQRESYEEVNAKTPTQLMMAAQNKFHAATELGRWNKPSASESRIFALEAMLKHQPNFRRGSFTIPRRIS